MYIPQVILAVAVAFALHRGIKRNDKGWLVIAVGLFALIPILSILSL